jgi:hypothetical protein
MPQEFTTIGGWGGGSSEVCCRIPDIQILGATAFDDQLASELVIGKIFLKEGDCTWRLSAPVECIADGE